jgi:FtsH-binding integral membrane protein
MYGNGKFGIIALMLGAWVVAWLAQKAALEISAALGTVLFLVYAALIGAMLSGIFIVYPRRRCWRRSC